MEMELDCLLSYHSVLVCIDDVGRFYMNLDINVEPQLFLSSFFFDVLNILLKLRVKHPKKFAFIIMFYICLRLKELKWPLL